jgi:hypothetical protein
MRFRDNRRESTTCQQPTAHRVSHWYPMMTESRLRIALPKTAMKPRRRTMSPDIAPDPLLLESGNAPPRSRLKAPRPGAVWRSVALASLLSLMAATRAQAAETASPEVFRLEGRITPESVKEIEATLKRIDATRGRIVLNALQLHSSGGDPDAAIRIGRIIRARRLNTVVPESARCSSACVYILAAGVQRYAFGAVGVHQARYNRVSGEADMAARVRAHEREIRRYYDEMGIGPGLVEAMFSTPAWSIRVLTEDEKHDWRLSGTDSVEINLQVLRLSKQHHRWPREIHDLLDANHDDCLASVESSATDVFQCSVARGHPPPDPWDMALMWWRERFGAFPASEDAGIPFRERINRTDKQVMDEKIYWRPMTVVQQSPQRRAAPEAADQSTGPAISAKVTEAIEAAGLWWIAENTLHMRVVNPARQPVATLRFQVSSTDCNSAGELRELTLRLLAPLEPGRTVVYVGKLPFDYARVYGRGKRCGTVTQAFGPG